jgi:hypothetical protein
LLLPAAPALAAPPDNDNREDATRLTPPEAVNGTVRDATVEPNEFFASCEATDASVWYRFTAPATGEAIIQLDAGGDLDAVIDVFKRERSELTPETCDVTDKEGKATLELDDLEGEYMIRVGKQFDSVTGNFNLSVLVPNAPARPPGKLLPAKGVKDTVDRLINPSDAYSVQMTAGVPYRLNLRIPEDQCTSLSVYAPGTGSFDSEPERTLPCGGYRLFSPEQTGRYSLLVEATRGRETKSYKLRVKQASFDDTTPGIFIRNDSRVNGRVNGGIDFVDVYRFDITSRSSLDLRVSGGPQLTLIKPGGRRIATGTSRISQDVGVGRFYVAVRGAGSYKLRRISKTLTRSRIAFDGRRKKYIAPGQSSRLVLSVSPKVSGRSTILIERFDPLEGWLFLRRIHPRVFDGHYALTFTPPTIGRYRARAEFLGSKLASPSDAGGAQVRVRAPLVQ